MKENINAQRVMTNTQQILTTLTSKVDLKKEYKESEWKKMLTEVIKEIHEGEKGEKKKRKKVKKEEEEEKKKREPTAYNLFVKETMSVVKEENPEMSRQDLMREVGRMWKEKKGKEKEEDEEEVKDEVVEEKEEDEEEVKEEEVVEKKEKKKGKKGKKFENNYFYDLPQDIQDKITDIKKELIIQDEKTKKRLQNKLHYLQNRYYDCDDDELTDDDLTDEFILMKDVGDILDTVVTNYYILYDYDSLNFYPNCYSKDFIVDKLKETYGDGDTFTNKKEKVIDMVFTYFTEEEVVFIIQNHIFGKP